MEFNDYEIVEMLRQRLINDDSAKVKESNGVYNRADPTGWDKTVGEFAIETNVTPDPIASDDDLPVPNNVKVTIHNITWATNIKIEATEYDNVDKPISISHEVVLGDREFTHGDIKQMRTLIKSLLLVEWHKKDTDFCTYFEDHGCPAGYM